MSIRVLLVDDHQMMRDGLRSILDLEGDLDVVGEAANGHEALEMVETLQPDVIVMDVGMKVLNGIEATRQIKDGNPRVNVIGLSTYSDGPYVLSMLEAGASGYVIKDNAVDEIRRAIRAVAAGHHYLCPEIAKSVVDSNLRRSSEEGGSAYSLLGSREREILQLLAEGHTSGEIGQQLHIATTTVDSHRRNIMRKLDVHSVAELTKLAIRQGLTPLDR
jgi:two-component system NarL family response regulator